MFSDGTQATGRDASAIRMLWVGYCIVLISRMLGEMDRVLALPRVCDALCCSVRYLYLNVGLLQSIAVVYLCLALCQILETMRRRPTDEILLPL